MRENRTYGLTRGKGMNSFLYSTSVGGSARPCALPRIWGRLHEVF